MCKGLSELEKAMCAYAARFEVGAVPPGQLAGALQAAGRIEKVAATLGSLIAARLAGLGPGELAGRQAERALARSSGTSLADAHRAIAAGQAMAAQPEVAAAARGGQLSRQQAALVSDAVAANPGAGAALVQKAAQLGLGELAEECARAKAARVSLEEQRRAAHAARGVRAYCDPGGAWHMHTVGLPEHGAQVEAVLSQLATGIFAQARREGRRERPQAYLYDAFMALVALATGEAAPGPGSDAGEASQGGGPQAEAPNGAGARPGPAGPAHGRLPLRLRPSFMVRADLGALLRGYPVEGEVCEIAGFGPVSTQAALDLVETQDPFLKAIVTNGHQVVGVAHLGRRPDAYQRSALDWLYPTCAAEGCSTRAERLQSDHRADWAQAHFTAFDLLDRLCRLHHSLKTRYGWALVEGRGKRAFVAPEDPRHPGQARRPSTSGAGPPGP
jgi:hypothetical protein